MILRSQFFEYFAPNLFTDAPWSWSMPDDDGDEDVLKLAHFPEILPVVTWNQIYIYIYIIYIFLRKRQAIYSWPRFKVCMVGRDTFPPLAPQPYCRSFNRKKVTRMAPSSDVRGSWGSVMVPNMRHSSVRHCKRHSWRRFFRVFRLNQVVSWHLEPGRVLLPGFSSSLYENVSAWSTLKLLLLVVRWQTQQYPGMVCGMHVYGLWQMMWRRIIASQNAVLYHIQGEKTIIFHIMDKCKMGDSSQLYRANTLPRTLASVRVRPSRNTLCPEGNFFQWAGLLVPPIMSRFCELGSNC